MRTLGMVALYHALVVIAPGPDFALLLRNSLRGHRLVAVATAAGIASGIAFHSTYALLGLSWLIQTQPFALTLVQILGGLYLAFQGLRALTRRSSRPAGTVQSLEKDNNTESWSIGWRQGLLVNVLNPNATLFIVGIFAGVVPPSAPPWLRVICAVEMIVATAAWFGALALVLTRSKVRHVLARMGPVLTWIAGIALIAFGVRLLLAAKCCR
jgi:threonine/homoserine/homoserine lactone efflux protein